jgi:hypothetical protein
MDYWTRKSKFTFGWNTKIQGFIASLFREGTSVFNNKIKMYEQKVRRNRHTLLAS